MSSLNSPGPSSATDGTDESTAQSPRPRVVILGGGPAGYEAALMAKSYDADVTLIEAQGCGGSAVLSDVVPSKTLISMAQDAEVAVKSDATGVRVRPCVDADGTSHPDADPADGPVTVDVDFGRMNADIVTLAAQQSIGIQARCEVARTPLGAVSGTGSDLEWHKQQARQRQQQKQRDRQFATLWKQFIENKTSYFGADLDHFQRAYDKVSDIAGHADTDATALQPAETGTAANGHGSITVKFGTGKLTSKHTVEYHPRADIGSECETLEADIILLAVGASPRELSTAMPDGDRILTWKQLYNLTERPDHLIVVGSGVTGAEFAGAYASLGVNVTLVSSRHQVLPGEDPDAASVIQDVFVKDLGVNVMDQVRANSVTNTGDGVRVELSTGEIVEGSHCLMAVGSVPNTTDIGLDTAGRGVRTTKSGHIKVDRVSRTNVPGIYAAGDCTGVFPLASVAAMQGRTAMQHALGDAVTPLELRTVCANVFTSPEIATVGMSSEDIEKQGDTIETVLVPLDTNPRARMDRETKGFVKLFCRKGPGAILRGVVVAHRASDLIYPLTMAVQHRLTVDQLASTFTIYPSLSGSLAEAGRQLHRTLGDWHSD